MSVGQHLEEDRPLTAGEQKAGTRTDRTTVLKEPPLIARTFNSAN